MENKETKDLNVAKNHDLNEEAEYTGSKQDLDVMLLEAQRYLNIFHQIHIFNDKKKEEFDKSLIEMPEKLRAVLLNLPGGRVLLEHIEDCEIAKGLRQTRTIFGDEDPFLRTEKKNEQVSIANKEFTKAITDTITSTMTEYNNSLLQINEKITENNKQLADVLRENNQQQIEMVKTFGSSLSQAILMSQKEMLNSIEKAQANTMQSNENKIQRPVKRVERINEINERNYAEPAREIPTKRIYVARRADTSTVQPPKTIQVNTKQFENVKNEIPERKIGRFGMGSLIKKAKKDETPEIDLTDVLSSDKNSEKSAKIYKKDDEINTSAPSSFGATLKKIKNAITEPASLSLDDEEIVPVSLGSSSDDLVASFTKGFKSSDKKAAPLQNKKSEAEDKWEYVDENGNPINPEEWEYVDENGNPINPEEWEYVDENGNPINPEEWEYVDENGNPIK